MNWILGIICSFKGHVPEKFLTETEFSIRTKRCKRCKAPLGMGHWKLIKQVPPCYCTQEEWAMFCEERFQEIRNSV